MGYAAVMFEAVGGGDVAAQTVARWSGRALDPAIVAVFADAPGERRENIETARQMYEAFGRGDVQVILDRVTDDVDWSTDAAIASAPWYGPRHGKDGLVSFFQAIATTGPVTEFTPLAFAGNDDGDVMVFIRYAFTVTATGKQVAMNMHHYWKFRDGKACFVRSSEDTAQVTAALTP